MGPFPVSRESSTGSELRVGSPLSCRPCPIRVEVSVFREGCDPLWSKLRFLTVSTKELVPSGESLWVDPRSCLYSSVFVDRPD